MVRIARKDNYFILPPPFALISQFCTSKTYTAQFLIYTILFGFFSSDSRR